MYCIECGNPLPDVRDDSTICGSCKTPLATWWDEATQTYRTNRETLLPYVPRLANFHLDDDMGRNNTQTIEERCFQSALICLEGHFQQLPGFGSRTFARVKKMVNNTLDMSLNKGDVRYVDSLWDIFTLLALRGCQLKTYL